MFKRIKVPLITVGCVLLSLLALPLLIDVNDYKSEISQAVYQATGRDLSIEHIEVSVFPWVGVTLHQVQLQNASGFTQQHMLSVKAVDVQLELIPLFSQRIEVKRFTLDTPQIWLEKDADGQNNWSDLLEKKDKKAAAKPEAMLANTAAESTATSASAMTFNAKLLRLNDGQVHWLDASYGAISLSDIQLSVHDLQLETPIGIDLAARLGQDDFVFKADIGPLADLKTFDILKTPIAVRLKSNRLSLAPFGPWLPSLTAAEQARFGPLQDASLQIDIALDQHADGELLSSGQVGLHMKHQLTMAWKLAVQGLQKLHLQTLTLDLNEQPLLSLSGEVKNLQHQPSFEVRLASGLLQRVWLNQFLPELAALYQGHGKPWKSVKLDALVAGDTHLVDVRNLQLQLDDESVQVSGNMMLGKAPDIQLRISSNSLHLDPWIPPSKPQVTIQTALEPYTEIVPASNQAVEPNLRFLKHWYVSLQVNIQALHIMQLKLEALRLTLSAEKGMIRLNPLRFDVGGGQITENFTLNSRKYPVTWQESMRITGVQVLPVLSALADVDILSGTTQLTTDLTGKGLLPDNILRSLKGHGQFVFEDGQVEGLNIAQEIRKFNNAPAANQKNMTDFAQMQGSFTIKKGVVHNKDLYMASPLFRLTGKGKLFLDPLRVDYHVRPKLIESLEGQGGSASQKGVTIPLHISGPFADLDISVQMDKDALLESAAALNKLSGNKIGGVAGKVLDQGFVQTREEEKKKLAKKLKRQLAAEKARLKKKAEDKLKKQAEDKLKNALQGFSF